MPKKTVLAELVYQPCCVGRRSCSSGRIVVGDMVRAGSLELDRLFDEIPLAINHLRPNTCDSWPCQILYLQLGEELLSSSRHLPLRYGREPLLACQFEEVTVVE